MAKRDPRMVTGVVPQSIERRTSGNCAYQRQQSAHASRTFHHFPTRHVGKPPLALVESGFCGSQHVQQQCDAQDSEDVVRGKDLVKYQRHDAQLEHTSHGSYDE